MRLRQSQNKIFKKCRTLKMCLNASLSLDSLLLLFLEGRGEWIGTDFVTSVDNEYETEHTEPGTLWTIGVSSYEAYWK